MGSGSAFAVLTIFQSVSKDRPGMSNYGRHFLRRDTNHRQREQLVDEKRQLRHFHVVRQKILIDVSECTVGSMGPALMRPGST